MTYEKTVSAFPAGVIQMPPSKSVAHRAVICAGLAGGESVLQNLAHSEDIEATARCMAHIRTPGAVLDCGESGSTLRFLIPLAAALTGSALFTGRGRLMERPLGPYVETLGQHGVTLETRDGLLNVSGKMRAGTYRISGNVSSQFITGLLFALSALEENSEILLTTPLESKGYVDLTLDVMARFGVDIQNEDYRRFLIKGGQGYLPCRFTVEADYSQAAFFLAASALDAECECAGLNPDSRQGDRAIVELLTRSGVELLTTERGGLVAKPCPSPAAQTVDASDIPDLVPPLAAFLCFCAGESRIINAGRLRIKESDRLAAVTEELNALGAHISIDGDSLIIRGRPTLRGGRMKSHNDHRIAMMGAVAAVRCRELVTVEDAGCVAKSYPGFWQDFEQEARA